LSPCSPCRQVEAVEAQLHSLLTSALLLLPHAAAVLSPGKYPPFPHRMGDWMGTRVGTGARGRSLPVVWRGRVHVTGPDEGITEQAEVDGVVSCVQSSRVFVLCFEHHRVYN